jgi:predicted nucleotidyltransferase
VFVATPHYLLAMKLHALANLDRGDKDMDDARRLAAHLGLVGEDDLIRLYRSIYDEDPPIEASVRFPTVLG